MTKFNESGPDRARRMALGKPHIYWSTERGDWLASGLGCPATESGYAKECAAVLFCLQQDRRWTPRSTT